MIKDETSPEEVKISKQIGDYQLQKIIGRGTFGIVYQAYL
jgi:hypothetical protein